VTVAIVVPWYAALYQANGWEPIRWFFVGENLERYVSGFGTESRGPFFYLPVVFTDGLPWSLLLPVAAAAWFRQRRGPASREPDGRVRTLLWFWILAFVGVFSLSGTKQDLYILPVATAVAVLGADVLARGSDAGAGWRHGVRWGLLATGLLLACAGALVLYVFEQAGGAYVLTGTGLLGSAGILGGLATVGLAGGRRIGWAAIALVASLVVVNWTLVLRVLPAFEQYKPVVPLSETILAHARPDDRVVHYDVGMPSMVFYLKRRVEAAFSREAFLDNVRTGGTVFAVMPEDRYEQVKTELGPTACVLARQPTFDAKLREMLARRPPPAIVVVGTPCPR
jgi:4-amino-4-deoxy-L-arabinose transferase-like glycosyltransferase